MNNILRSSENYNLCWKYLDKDFKKIILYITDNKNKFLKNGLVCKIVLNGDDWNINLFENLNHVATKELGLQVSSNSYIHFMRTKGVEIVLF